MSNLLLAGFFVSETKVVGNIRRRNMIGVVRKWSPLLPLAPRSQKIIGSISSVSQGLKTRYTPETWGEPWHGLFDLSSFAILSVQKHLIVRCHQYNTTAPTVIRL